MAPHNLHALELSITLAFALILLTTLSSAVTLSSGTVLNTSASNTSLTFIGTTLYVDQIEIGADYITLYNVTCLSSASASTVSVASVLNYTAANTNYDSVSLGACFPSPTGGSLSPQQAWLLETNGTGIVTPEGFFIINGTTNQTADGNQTDEGGNVDDLGFGSTDLLSLAWKYKWWFVIGALLCALIYEFLYSNSMIRKALRGS